MSFWRISNLPLRRRRVCFWNVAPNEGGGIVRYRVSSQGLQDLLYLEPMRGSMSVLFHIRIENY